MNQESFEEEIRTFFPDWDFSIVEYTGTRKKLVIKCNNCGRTECFNEARGIFKRINSCKCYNRFRDTLDKIRYFSKIYNFTIINYDGYNATIKCNLCHKETTKTIVALKQYPNACECKNNYYVTKEELQKRLDESMPNEYLLLESNGATGKALIKHLNCGFVFTIPCFWDLLNGRNRGCPKCYKFISKGEQSIAAFLEEHNIHYIPQKTFAPLNKSKYRFDFFIPQYNLAIEYQGEQHYRDNKFFKDSLSSIQKRDEIKRQYCKEHNIELLEISYKDYKNIPHILSSKFNDYDDKSVDSSESKQTTSSILEDIV